MGIFRRVSDIISANVNEMVESFESPEMMLRQAIREMDAAVGRTAEAAARAIAESKLLENQLNRQRPESTELHRRAQTLTARPLTRSSKHSSKHSSASARRRKTQAVMGLSETILFYLLFGMAVAAAVAIDREHRERPERVFRAATALFFWPLYIP